MEFVRKNNVKIFVNRKKLRVAPEIYEAANKRVAAILKEACERARKNGRGTVMERDF